LKIWLLLLVVATIQSAVTSTYSQSIIKSPAFSKATILSTEVRTVHSSIVGQDYEITVALPTDYDTSNTTYGVIYAPDEFLLFRSLVDSYRILRLGKEIPPLVIVGIGFHDTSTNYEIQRSSVRAFRTRDLTPSNVDSLDKQRMMPFGVKTGGAGNFLAFLKQELMPFVEKNYRVSTTDKTLLGYSLGGLFGIYTLFHSPKTFSRYLIGSPTLNWANENVGVSYEQAYAKNNIELSAKVFMSMGSLEGVDVDLFKQAEKALLSRNYKGLNLKTWIFMG
jgi:predicted alpha/beta superfamily hydrolase